MSNFVEVRSKEDICEQLVGCRHGITISAIRDGHITIIRHDRPSQCFLIFFRMGSVVENFWKLFTDESGMCKYLYIPDPSFAITSLSIGDLRSVEACISWLSVLSELTHNDYIRRIYRKEVSELFMNYQLDDDSPLLTFIPQNDMRREVDINVVRMYDLPVYDIGAMVTFIQNNIEKDFMCDNMLHYNLLIEAGVPHDKIILYYSFHSTSTFLRLSELGLHRIDSDNLAYMRYFGLEIGERDRDLDDEALEARYLKLVNQYGTWENVPESDKGRLEDDVDRTLKLGFPYRWMVEPLSNKKSITTDCALSIMMFPDKEVNHNMCDVVYDKGYSNFSLEKLMSSLQDSISSTKILHVISLLESESEIDKFSNIHGLLMESSIICRQSMGVTRVKSSRSN